MTKYLTTIQQIFPDGCQILISHDKSKIPYKEMVQCMIEYHLDYYDLDEEYQTQEMLLLYKLWT
jgi:hypothetical protein